MFEEYHKKESERVPLPNPPPNFLAELEYIKKHYQEQETEKEKELPRSLSPIDHKKKKENPIKIEDLKMVEGGLAECPNCSRTFFPDRLMVHLKSWKPGKPLMPKKKKRINMRWKNMRKKEVPKNKFRMPLLGKGNFFNE